MFVNDMSDTQKAEIGSYSVNKGKLLPGCVTKVIHSGNRIGRDPIGISFQFLASYPEWEKITKISTYTL